MRAGRCSKSAIDTICIAALLMCAALATHAAADISQPPLSLIATRVPVAGRLPLAPVHSVFHVAKSENKNQVHYGVRVDRLCRPAGKSPVYAYWRMRERGPRQFERLLGHEQPAYGLHDSQRVERSARGGKVRVQLRAFPDRPITIEVYRQAQGCVARGLVRIHHQPAIVQSIYIDIGFLFSLNYAQVSGVRIADGRAVQEKLEP